MSKTSVIKTSVMSFLSVVIIFGLVGTVPNVASGAKKTYSFTRIADTRSGVFTTFSGSAPTINASGFVAFAATVAGGGGVFIGEGHALSTIADTSTYPAFREFEVPSINDAGSVAFIPLDTSRGAIGIYTSDGTTLTEIVPSGRGIGVPWLNNSGTVAAALGGREVVAGNGGPLVTIAGPTSGVQYAEASLNDNGAVAYFASGVEPLLPNGAKEAIFLSDSSGVRVLVDNHAALAHNNGGFRDTRCPLNNRGVIAFQFIVSLDRPDDIGIFLTDGVNITPVVDTTGPFRLFGAVALNNQDSVAFLALFRNSDQHGIFTGPDAQTDQVIVSGTKLHGRRISSLALSYQALNDSGQIAFIAYFEDGSEAIYRADPK